MQQPPGRKGNVRGQVAIFRCLAVGVVGCEREIACTPWRLFRWGVVGAGVDVPSDAFSSCSGSGTEMDQ